MRLNNNFMINFKNKIYYSLIFNIKSIQNQYKIILEEI